jgi:succinate dehydrogenase/fumarate reductase flavoprotein subunit
MARPFPAHRGNRALVAAGYLIEAPTLSDLADRLGVPQEAFGETVAAHNGFAERGADEDFGKGASRHNRVLGDPAIGPNPCLAPIARAPFYAVAVHSGDLGTARGLVTDSRARVLGPEGIPVPGLYAVGNDMHSIMGGTYPGAGITLGPALVFAYLAAGDIARRAGLPAPAAHHQAA